MSAPASSARGAPRNGGAGRSAPRTERCSIAVNFSATDCRVARSCARSSWLCSIQLATDSKAFAVRSSVLAARVSNLATAASNSSSARRASSTEGFGAGRGADVPRARSREESRDSRSPIASSLSSSSRSSASASGFRVRRISSPDCFRAGSGAVSPRRRRAGGLPGGVRDGKIATVCRRSCRVRRRRRDHPPRLPADPASVELPGRIAFARGAAPASPRRRPSRRCWSALAAGKPRQSVADRIELVVLVPVIRRNALFGRLLRDYLVQPIAQAHARATRSFLRDLSRFSPDSPDAPSRGLVHFINRRRRCLDRRAFGSRGRHARCFDADGEQTIKVAPKWVNSGSFHLFGLFTKVVALIGCKSMKIPLTKGHAPNRVGGVCKPSGSPGG